MFLTVQKSIESNIIVITNTVIKLLKKMLENTYNKIAEIRKNK